MKRYISVILCVILFVSFPALTAASETLPLIIDNGDILSNEEERLLEAEAAALQKEFAVDVVIHTLDSLYGKNISAYADDYYDSVGYSEDGILLVLAMQEGEWYISTCGEGIFVLTDYGIQRLSEDFLPYLSAGRYYDGLHVYLKTLPEYFEAFRAGSPVDGYADYSGDYYHGQQDDTVYYNGSGKPNIPLSMVIGLVAATISILIMRGAMNTKKPKSSAHSYLKNGSYHLRTHQDLFLYSNISKVRRQENSSNGGGGSSVHRSSGGIRHGGGGGKF